MGNCAASPRGGGADGLGDGVDPVALCRDRKRLIKLAGEKRFLLAGAHAAYVDSLAAVAAAIDLFVARHVSPAPILITLTESSSSPPHTPKPLPPPPQERNDSLQRSPEVKPPEAPFFFQQNEKPQDMETQHFFFPTPTTAPPPPPEVAATDGWDFFNPFFVGDITDEEMRALREREGIPELEEAEGEEKVTLLAACDGPHHHSQPPPAAAEEPEKESDGAVVEVTQGRELLAALEEIAQQLRKAFEAGKEVSKMLEANRVCFQSGLDELKGSSSKIIHAITWHRSPSSLSSSSYRSQLGASSSSLSWCDSKSESRSDIFEEYGGMSSGSHAQTLGRLYAWEKKLYDEVKNIDHIRQAYEKKCVKLRNEDAKGAEPHSSGKTRTALRELHSKTWVALRAAETISQNIQKLRDEELQPQLTELLQGLARTWKTFVESHESQRQIMLDVTSFNCPSYGRFSNDHQRLATLKLEAELNNWRACFLKYAASQRAYADALDGWLSKFITTEAVCRSRGVSSLASCKNGTPPLVVLCHDWSVALRKSPDKQVGFSMRSFIRSVRVLSLKQAEEQKQKSKVDSLTKEIDKRYSAFKRAENKLIEVKLSEHIVEQDAKQQRIEALSERKEMLNSFRRKLESEKCKHLDCMRDTHDVTLNGFKIGLAGIFESLTDFCKDSLKLLENLLAEQERLKNTGQEANLP